MRHLIRLAILAAISMIICPPTPVNACTRVVYKSPGGLVLTARSMDWKEDILTNLWIFPRGMQRSGEAGPNSIKWTSKYGSVTASGYDISTTDGMNEKGLVANVLWLVESEYPPYNGSGPGLSIAAWVQYVLDNFATVNETVEALRQEKFTVVTDKVPGMERLATLHLSVSDASGDNAIFEYINGKLVIHHDTAYTVMTNSPIFDKQLALGEYWKEIGGTVMLPGTNRASDRFIRASFYIKAIPQTDNTHVATAAVFSVIRNCSVPLGISSPEQPNISSTRWRSVSDHKNLIYYFETALTPNTFWVDFKNVNFSKGARVKKLGLTKGEIYAGDAAKKFVNAQPFRFQGLGNH
ncbi:linear amide C-N hydrolase [Chitinophaga barathri]|uniref:Linear amide C-N hydrolase n=1 Tax=Chitinophaga barathri TaxID=1647451 RepID=A0A3N4ME15_9BACT|nr:linear amide C-N hydrolase [Chitinophaga barathri]RPD42144.1 linear amide C-N hydrolase [Chitinophaga barathri]